MNCDSVARVCCLFSFLTYSACSKVPQRAEPQTLASVTPKRAGGAFAWHYRAALDARGELSIDARFDGKTDGEFSIDDELARFVRKFEVAQGDHWQAIAKPEMSWLG